MKGELSILKLARKIHVAAIQMNTILGDRKQNYHKAKKLIAEAVEKSAQIIVLPELFDTGYRVEEQDTILAQSIPGPVTDWLEKLAKEYQVVLVTAILEKEIETAQVYDTAVIVSPDGLVGSYRKIQLWGMEKSRFQPGNKLPIFQIDDWKIGLQICYEIGFPEGARILSMKDAHLLLYPSAFGHERLYAWKQATRARALENGIYLVAANRSGIDKDETVFAGHSRIVNPQGQVLAEAAREDEVIVSMIDLEQIQAQREKIPYIKDLDHSLYQSEYLKIVNS